MVSRMFEFFFKYSRATYERAELVFASGWPLWLLVRARRRGRRRRRHHDLAAAAGLGVVRATVLGALQTALVAAVLVLAWRPALVTQTLRPQENSVAVLLDTSGSMLYGDEDTSRLQQAVDSLTDSALPALESRSPSTCFRSPASSSSCRRSSKCRRPGPSRTSAMRC